MYIATAAGKQRAVVRDIRGMGFIADPVTGKYDVIAVVTGRDLYAVTGITDKIYKLDGVTSGETGLAVSSEY